MFPPRKPALVSNGPLQERITVYLTNGLQSLLSSWAPGSAPPTNRRELLSCAFELREIAQPAIGMSNALAGFKGFTCVLNQGSRFMKRTRYQAALRRDTGELLHPPYPQFKTRLPRASLRTSPRCATLHERSSGGVQNQSLHSHTLGRRNVPASHHQPFAPACGVGQMRPWLRRSAISDGARPRSCCVRLRSHVRTGPEAAMQSIAGHLSKNMLDRCSHVRLAAKRQAVAGLGGGPHYAGTRRATSG